MALILILSKPVDSIYWNNNFIIIRDTSFNLDKKIKVIIKLSWLIHCFSNHQLWLGWNKPITLDGKISGGDWGGGRTLDTRHSTYVIIPLSCPCPDTDDVMIYILCQTCQLMSFLKTQFNSFCAQCAANFSTEKEIFTCDIFNNTHFSCLCFHK